MREPRFPVLTSLNVLGFLTLQLQRLLDISPEAWTQTGRLAYDRIEGVFEAVHAAAGHRLELTRKEAATLLALGEQWIDTFAPYDYDSLLYTGCDADHPRQEAIWAQAEAESHSPASLPALLDRLEIIVGLRTSLPGQLPRKLSGRG